MSGGDGVPLRGVVDGVVMMWVDVPTRLDWIRSD